MQRHVDQSPVGQSQARRNQPLRRATTPFAENRPEARQLAHFQEIADQSPQAARVSQLQARINNSVPMVAQRQQIGGIAGPPLPMGPALSEDVGPESDPDRSTATDSETRTGSAKENSAASAGVAQLKAIEKAGLELELKGASLLMEGATEADEPEPIPDKYHVHEGEDWWIEIDSNYPELVTKPVTSEADLLEKLADGKYILEWLQYLALVKDEQERSVIKEQLLEQGIADWLVPDLGDGSAYIAKPQLSLQIGKGKMNEFAEHVMSGKILHEKARVSKTDEVGYENTPFDRIDDGVSAIINQLKSTKFFDDVMGPLAADKTDAGGLAWISIITMLHAARYQDPENQYQYYKARFSVMPRTALSAMYDVLTEAEQTRYRKLMSEWITSVYESNEFGVGDAIETKVQNANKTMADRVKFSAIYRSIINERSAKTTMKSGVEAQTDLIAADAVAGTQNTGASVGNYDVPEGASGLFELRKIPYVSIQGEEAAKIYREIIAAYGGL